MDMSLMIKDLERELADLRDTEKDFKAKWESQKELINRIQQNKIGFVTYAHLMVVLITFFKASKYGYGTHLIRFVDHNLLETTFESFIFFNA